jgi:hypothetical protein
MLKEPEYTKEELICSYLQGKIELCYRRHIDFTQKRLDGLKSLSN